MAAANKAAGKTGIFRLFLSILLLLILPAASLSQTVPWLEALEQAEGFEQQDGGNWVYQQMAAYSFTDGRAFFGLEGATHTVSGEVLICAFAGLSDIRNQPLASVTRFDVLIGDQVWSWHQPVVGKSASLVYLGESERDFLDALAKAEQVNVQLHFLARKMLVSFQESETEKLRKAASLLAQALEAVDTGSDSITGRYEQDHPVRRQGVPESPAPAGQ